MRSFYWFAVLLVFGNPVFAQDKIRYTPLFSGKAAVDNAETAKKPDVEAPVEQTQQVAPDETYLLKRGTKELQIKYGISPFNPSNFAGPKEFDVYGRHLHLFTVRFARVIGTKRNVSYEYMFGATPLAIFTKNEVVNKNFVSAAATPNTAPTKRETTYGAGFQPVNFKFIFLAKIA